MNHLSEEQLILHYYGEEPETVEAGEHLETCPGCRAAYGALQRVLNVVDSLPVPDRSDDYAGRVWRRIEHQLPAGRGLSPIRFLPLPWRWAAAGAAFAGLLAVAFLAGRFYPTLRKSAPAVAADPHAGDRILLLAVGDYLERSQMVLIELQNANPKRPLDISAEQERAVDLVGESRLYRQTAERTGHTRVAGVLDDLDRVLLEIAHGPSRLSPGELQSLRQRLEAEGILFKIRVLGSNVRNQEEAGPESSPQGRQKL
jgi:hypothetical protein